MADKELTDGEINAGIASDADGQDPVSLVEKIARALQDAGLEDVEKDENSFELSLAEVLGLIPEHYTRQSEAGDIDGETVVVSLNDLYGSLRRGKIEMHVKDLAYFIPLHLIYHAAFDDANPIKIPLRSVVNAVSLQALRDRTPRTFRFYDTSEFDDPFTEAEADRLEIAPVIFEDEEKAVSGQPEEEYDGAITQRVDIDDQATETSTAKLDVPVLSKLSEEFELPVRVVLEALPEGSVVEGQIADGKVKVWVEHLYECLRKGVVKITLADLAACLPTGSVVGQASGDHETTAVLPLREVVTAIGADTLKALTPSQKRKYDIDWMEDPFKEPEILPKFVKAVKRPSHTDMETEREEQGARDTQGGAVVIPYSPSMMSEDETLYHELPGNVNINLAQPEELMILPGMNRLLAENIVAYRDKKGSYKTVFDLHNVQGVTETVFRKITGVDTANRRYHRRKRMAGLLKIPAERISDLSLVVHAMSSRPGFSGCGISDWDGLMLAQFGLDETGRALPALLPVMLRGLKKKVSLITEKKLDMLSLEIGGKIYTVSAATNVVLTTSWADNTVNDTGIALIRKVRKELSWLLSIRAYAGPSMEDLTGASEK